MMTFSDGVFAIAATLLVIDLRPPATSSATYAADLLAMLGRPTPFIAVAIGFLVVGSYWMSHRAIFALVRAGDATIAWANLAFLLFVALQPFFTAAIAAHDPTVVAVVAYAVLQVLTGIAQLGLWLAVLHDRTLLDPHVDARRIRYVTVQLLRAPITFAISIPITLAFGAMAGAVSWGRLVLAAVLIKRAVRDLHAPAVRPIARARRRAA